MPSAESVVNDFLTAICDHDLDAALALCADDVVYDNVPMSPVTGPEQIRQVLHGFLGAASQIEWIVHRQVASEHVVMNERDDRFLINGEWLSLPVAGVFEVRDGKITLWRDFFDLPTLQTQMEQLMG